MIEAPTSCQVRIELATLSAWRDRALPAGEYRRLAGHVAACAACQYRLRILDNIGHLLQLRDSDDYQEQIWQRLQAQMHRPAALRLAIPPHLIAAVSVLIVVALFLLLTYQRGELHQGHPMATATSLPTTPTTPTTVPVATPIVLAQAQLHWQPTAPRAWQAAGDGNTVWFAPAPSNGMQAYVCTQPTGTASVQIWKTNNRGVSWLSLGTIATVANGSCVVTVDRNNPNIVILGTTLNAHDGPMYEQSYISHDGGKTWQAFQLGEFIGDIEFGATTSYAQISDGSSNGLPYLAVSHDNFKTWQKIMPSHELPYDFWVSSSGELLLASDPDKIWLTDDQGQTWRSIPLPTKLGNNIQAYQQAGTAVWIICARVQQPQLYCSLDSGQTWHSYMLPDSDVNSALLLGVAADHTIIVSLFSNSPTQHLSRFSPESGQWQPLGAVPDATVAFAQTPGGAGILWTWYTASPGDDAQQRNFTALLP